jgi:putative membrane protein
MSRRIGILVGFVLCAAPAIAQTPVSTNDFATKVAISDMMEIQSSRLALDRQPGTDTKPFAERMIKDHTQTSKELRALVDTGRVKVSLPSGLDPEHQKKLEELKAKSGRDFDRAYDQMQLQAHEEAVALFSNYAMNGDNPDLKVWAAQTLPHLRDHLAMAEKLPVTNATLPAPSYAQETTGLATPGQVQVLNAIPEKAITIANYYKQNVYDTSEHKIGEIVDALINPDGTVGAFIIAVGGFLGIGERDLAVPFQAVSATDRKGTWYLTMNATRDSLQAAPDFKYDKANATWTPAT